MLPDTRYNGVTYLNLGSNLLPTEMFSRLLLTVSVMCKQQWEVQEHSL